MVEKLKDGSYRVTVPSARVVGKMHAYLVCVEEGRVHVEVFGEGAIPSPEVRNAVLADIGKAVVCGRVVEVA